jgi:hypothetical protein
MCDLGTMVPDFIGTLPDPFALGVFMRGFRVTATVYLLVFSIVSPHAIVGQQVADGVL